MRLWLIGVWDLFMFFTGCFGFLHREAKSYTRPGVLVCLICGAERRV